MRKLSIIIALLLLLSIPVIASATHWEIPEDAYGVWYVPDLHFACPVYTAQTWREWQPIIDAEQSMLMLPYLNAMSVSDHHGSRGQDGEKGWYVQNIKLLSTAYMITHTETKKYECYLTAVAVPHSYGYLVNGVPIQPTSSTDIMVRCCVGSDATRNYIAMFRLVKTL